ncbi:3-dehydroquinate synthase [Sedimentitalea sp. JM2-8]|uniref:3-dehydroquinate synthase n=1 Tax=Sedimentitalea xiamensis TaxID=3050037 RepID=A0ABT7FH70_9RHOB|nr:3-dehydroquinate synthase [Sedimentitalea xiamensis]MDK3074485.1 3-dehydroquinate synthase [Sedimentitalea xiamensis]
MNSESAMGLTHRQDATVYWQEFSVPYVYPVAFVRGLFAPENPLFADVLARKEPAKRHRCFFVLDEGTVRAMPGLVPSLLAYAQSHSDRIDLIADPMILPGGEIVKNELAHVERMQDAIHAHAIDRHSYVIAIGGGAILDAVGLAAATAHRGVRHIRVPTTVLSQNDSGVGVKNAVNFKGIKNYVGTFAPPWAVLNDFEFLEHLPRRERIAGIAEAVKVALIRDRDFYLWLEENADALATFRPDAEEHMIRRSAELHMRQIAHGGDPFELGSARPLDFGHWSAHKLEAMTHHHVRHGEAVAIGIALDARYSVLAGLLTEGEEERIVVLLENLGLRIWHPALENAAPGGELALLKGLAEFQEHLGGELTITLLKDLGVGHEVHQMDLDRVRQALAWLKAREKA